jgi:hypothetical protein
VDSDCDAQLRARDSAADHHDDPGPCSGRRPGRAGATGAQADISVVQFTDQPANYNDRKMRKGEQEKRRNVEVSDQPRVVVQGTLKFLDSQRSESLSISS